MPKILWYAQNSQCVQNSIFPSEKHIFPILLQILKLEVCGIYHSLYVKFEINVNSFILCKLSILFSTVKLRP